MYDDIQMVEFKMLSKIHLHAYATKHNVAINKQCTNTIKFEYYCNLLIWYTHMIKLPWNPFIRNRICWEKFVWAIFIVLLLHGENRIKFTSYCQNKENFFFLLFGSRENVDIR